MASATAAPVASASSAPSASASAAPASSAATTSCATPLYFTLGVAEVRDAPRADAALVGKIRAGGHACLASSTSAGDAGCAGGWLAVEPHGFVCAGPGSTRDAASPAVRALTRHALAPSAPLPASYGVASETPVYLRVPTYAEQRASEPKLETHLQRRAEGAKAAMGAREPEFELAPAGEEIDDDVRGGAFAPFAPRAVAEGAPVVGAIGDGTPVWWTAELDVGGRTWLVTPDLLLVPRDRVRRATVSGYHGHEIEKGARVALVRGRAAPKLEMGRGGFFKRRPGESWPMGELVALGDDEKRVGADVYLSTREPGTYVAAADVVPVVDAAAGALGLAADERWVEIAARAQTLVLREGDRALFATLVAVGSGGVPRGTLRVRAKHLSLAPPFDKPREGAPRAEVPRVVLAGDPTKGENLVLDAGWTTSVWGRGKGGPGVTLAPLDARRVFDFVDPKLPEGWHAAVAAGTRIVVHD